MSDKRQYRQVKGQFNPMSVCRECDKDATQTRMSYYCINLIEGNPHRCDECRKAP